MRELPLPNHANPQRKSEAILPPRDRRDRAIEVVPLLGNVQAMNITIPALPSPPIRINVRRLLLVQNAGTTNVYISSNYNLLVSGSIPPKDGYTLPPGNSLPEIPASTGPLYAVADSPSGSLVVEEEPAAPSTPASRPLKWWENRPAKLEDIA